MLRVTLSKLDGSYIFHDLPSASGLKLAMLQDGILRPALRSSGNWLRVNQFDILGENDIVGPAHNVSSPVFGMLLDDEQQPLYNRLLSYNTFQGNAKSLSWWRFMLSGLGELEGDLTLAELSAWNTEATASLKCSASISSSNPLEANLKAAALNNVSGRGLFEPYQILQGWMIRYAEHVFCDHVASASDQALALRFMQQINTAIDIDRVA
jgi:hypothetical protein